MQKSLAVVLLCGLLVSLVTPRESSAVIFGTSSNGTPIVWDESALSGGTAVVDVNGYLQITSTGVPGQETALNYVLGLPLSHGNTPAMHIVWEDENTSGVPAADPPTPLPRLDFVAQDSRPGFALNRVVGGSLFNLGHYGAIRHNLAGPGTPNTSEFFTGQAPNPPQAPAGEVVVHSLTVQKQADGYVDFIYDGVLVAHSNALRDGGFMDANDGPDLGAGLGTNHSIWDFAQLRIRNSEANETFTIRSLQFVPEPSSLALLSLGLVALLRRRRPSTRCSS